MTSRPSITCYFDVVSPYSYFGIELLMRYKEQWKDVDVEYCPIFLMGVMNAANNQPPAHVAAKAAYMVSDLTRLSSITGIPMNFPSNFPTLTIPAMRLLIAIQNKEPSKFEQCIRKLFEEYWVNDKNVAQKDVLISALAPIFGSESKAQEYYDMTSDKEVKQQLVDNTQKAVDVGAFGAPTFVVKQAGSDEEHMVFGSDRFEYISKLIGQPYPGLAPTAKL